MNYIYSICRCLSILLLGTMVATHTNTSFAQSAQTLSLQTIQSRSFETTDQKKMLRDIASTLQDMGYNIGRIDSDIGFVSATQLSDSVTEITITTQPTKGAILVRASVRVNNRPLKNNPIFYQNFFNHLSQASFLNAHAIY